MGGSIKRRYLAAPANPNVHNLSEEDAILTANPYLVPLYNYFYYFAFIPFKTVLNENTNKYISETNRLQKVLNYVSFAKLYVIFFYKNIFLIQFNFSLGHLCFCAHFNTFLI